MQNYLASPLWALVAGFAALGGVGSVLMSRQPEFFQRWGLDHVDWGWALFAGGLGGVLAFPVNRFLLARWGSRRLLHRFGTAGGVVLAAIPWLPELGGLLAGLFTLGIIYNGVGVAINHQAAHWEVRQGRRMMGRLHATFFFGSVLSALLSSALAVLNVALALHMAVVGMVAACVHRSAAASLKGASQEAAGELVVVASSDAWRGLGLLFCWCTVLESGVMGWASVYLSEGLGSGASVAGLGFGVFCGTMAVGRLFCDLCVTRFGPLFVVRTGAIACALSLGLAAWQQSLVTALAAFAITGFGLAAAAPVIFSLTGRLGGETLARVSALGALGGLLGPLLLGRIAGWASLDVVLFALAAVSVAIGWQAGALARHDQPVPAASRY